MVRIRTRAGEEHQSDAERFVSKSGVYEQSCFVSLCVYCLNLLHLLHHNPALCSCPILSVALLAPHSDSSGRVTR